MSDIYSDAVRILSQPVSTKGTGVHETLMEDESGFLRGYKDSAPHRKVVDEDITVEDVEAFVNSLSEDELNHLIDFLNEADDEDDDDDDDERRDSRRHKRRHDSRRHDRRHEKDDDDDDDEEMDEASRLHSGERVTGKYRSAIGHYTVDHIVASTANSADPEYVVTQHDNHVSASGKHEPKQLKHRRSDLHPVSEGHALDNIAMQMLMQERAERLDELSHKTTTAAVSAAADSVADLSRGIERTEKEIADCKEPSHRRELRHELDSAKSELAKHLHAIHHAMEKMD